MNIEIRQATAMDSRIIAEAFTMALGEDVTKEFCGEDYIPVLEEIVKQEDTQYSYRNAFIAESDGKAVGAIIGYDGKLLKPLRAKTLDIIHKYNPKLEVTEDETEAGEFYLDSIGVIPGHRGEGIGRKLLLAMRDRAFAQGFDRVGLLVDFNNPDAERLYRSLGFEPVGTKDFFGHKMKHLQSCNL